MRYYRIHTADIAYITQQPRGIFTAIGKLVDAGILSEEETEEYWKNRAYFEKVLPVPPFYEEGNPDKAITWFKDTPEGNQIYSEMTFTGRWQENMGRSYICLSVMRFPGKSSTRMIFRLPSRIRGPIFVLQHIKYRSIL